jgi:nucleotide-binding universal stress UspA family protein
MYDEILYPTDGSSTAQAALDHARNRAERHDATVHVLYVVDMEHAGVGLAGDVDLVIHPGWSVRRPEASPEWSVPVATRASTT